jgi:hypothetical protein
MGMTCEVHAATADETERLLAEPDAVEELVTPAGRAARCLRLEKAWHGLHFLLTGSAWQGDGPLGFLVDGGEEVGQDLGYGPARLFPPDAVERLDSLLAAVSEEELWSCFDPETMEAEGVYPGIWDEDEEELRDEYLTYFRHLKKFVHRASEDQMALIIVLC